MVAVSRSTLRLCAFLLLAVAIGAVQFDRRHALPGKWHECVWLLLGGALALETSLDLRSGSTILVYSTIERATDPTGYWTAIAITGALALCVTIGTAGAIIGLWQW